MVGFAIALFAHAGLFLLSHGGDDTLSLIMGIAMVALSSLLVALSIAGARLGKLPLYLHYSLLTFGV